MPRPPQNKSQIDVDKRIKAAIVEVMSITKYPNIEVELTGTDGNAWSIVGNVQRSLRKAQVPKEEIEQFVSEATSGDYNNLLATAMRWVSVA